MAYRTLRYKRIGVCGNCGETVYAPLAARYLGTTKSCKACRNADPAAESEKAYFRKFSAEYQLETQGFVSSP